MQKLHNDTVKEGKLVMTEIRIQTQKRTQTKPDQILKLTILHLKVLSNCYKIFLCLQNTDKLME